MFPMAQREGAASADPQWARLQVDVNCRVRRGAWYRVADLTSAEAAPHRPVTALTTCRGRATRPGLPASLTMFPVAQREGAASADPQWARLQVDVNCRVRRGAWYRVADLTSAEARLDVNREQIP